MTVKNYLPSKKFTYIFIACIVALAVFLLISNIFFGKNSFVALGKKGQLQNEKLTIENLLQKDSDGDGVMDWEEALWGTNPNKEATFDGVSDSDYIKKKREALNLPEENGLAENGELNETDKFAQEFFASLSAMKQSGQIDKNTINNVSNALGQNIVDPTLADKYSEKDIKLDENDGVDIQNTYYTNVKNLFESYKEKGIGDELEIVSIIANSGAVESGVESANADKLAIIADAYQEFAQEMIKISVPESLAQYHIRIINNANNTGIAVRNMIKVMDDPIVGLSGLSQYQKYSDDLISSVGDLEAILSNNGIIVE